MNLNAEQRQAVFIGEAVRIQEGGLECVVVRADVFDRVKNLLYDASSWTPEELRQLLAKSAELNGWNEPAMDDYDHYDEEMPMFVDSSDILPHRGCNQSTSV